MNHAIRCEKVFRLLHANYVSEDCFSSASSIFEKFNCEKKYFNLTLLRDVLDKTIREIILQILQIHRLREIILQIHDTYTCYIINI